jgi:hypothetical protein
MKSTILSLAVLLLMISCQNDEKSNLSQARITKNCASQEVFDRQLKENPELALKMNQIEDFTEKAIQYGRLVNGKIEIPVVVNVLYNTASENISDALIDSQIKVLNEDFNAMNSDFNQVPTEFSGVKANVGISFVLDHVVRKSTNKKSWGTHDAMKRSNQGGISPTSPTTKLNMWVCTIGGGILGYAQFPGGNSATDGIVIDSKYFGLTNLANPYNLGRTATHEVGHWLNLRHIWGDSKCGNDLVADTPLHNTANYGVPAFPHYSTCSGSPIEMTMNYMDYTDDKAMYMFTQGQKSRMDALFIPGGARNSFAQP